jgi:hypothetical protein
LAVAEARVLERADGDTGGNFPFGSDDAALIAVLEGSAAIE